MKIEFESEKEREVFVGECGATLVMCSSLVNLLPNGLTAVEPTINNATACLMACGFTLEAARQVFEAETDVEAFQILGIGRYLEAAKMAQNGGDDVQRTN